MYLRTSPGAYLLSAMLATFLIPGVADAHFVWLNTTTAAGDKTYAFLYFSESADEQDYRLPERVAAADFWQRTPDGQKQPLSTEKLETEERIGLVAPLTRPEQTVLEATCRYGIYHGSLLTYYAKHVPSLSDQTAGLLRSSELALDIVPQVSGEDLQLTVLWKGEPLAGADVVIDAVAGDLVEAVTDEAGRVVFQPKTGGLIGVRAGHQTEDAGELDGTPYKGAAHHATLTLNWTMADAKNQAARVSYPDLPEPIASFGAAVHDGWVYVYGGHTGQSHAHSRENIFKRFVRLNLEDGAGWEELPMQTPVQSPALVAHGEYLYRIGGMTALNAPDEEDDLHSIAEFARFDPQAQEWTEMPALPRPRSSHDAVVIGDKLYVVGGWELGGPGHGEWCETALVYDLAGDGAEEPQWQELPAPEFRRRALAAAEWNRKLVAIGGMTDEREVSQRVDLFDPAAQEWSQGPDLPASDMHGFGISACNVNGSLYVSGASGVVYRLSDDGDAWEEVAELEMARFFHRLVPAPTGDLLAIAGAAHGHGHLASIEAVRVGGGTEKASSTTAGVSSAAPH